MLGLIRWIFTLTWLSPLHASKRKRSVSIGSLVHRIVFAMHLHYWIYLKALPMRRARQTADGVVSTEFPAMHSSSTKRIYFVLAIYLIYQALRSPARRPNTPGLDIDPSPRFPYAPQRVTSNKHTSEWPEGSLKNKLVYYVKSWNVFVENGVCLRLAEYDWLKQHSLAVWNSMVRHSSWRFVAFRSFATSFDVNAFDKWRPHCWYTPAFRYFESVMW